MQRLPSDGSARLPIEDYSGPTYFTAGYSPRPSPDGTLVAFDAYLGVVVAAANEPSSESWLGEAEHDGGAVVAALAWSADSARLVWIESLFHEGDVASLFVAEVSRDGEIGPPTPLEPSGGVAWTQAVFRRDGSLLVVERADGAADVGRVLDPDTGEITTFPFDGEVRSIGHDPSGTWLRVVYADGRLVGMGNGEIFEIATGIEAADW